jgi:hypothetical protein
MEVKLFWTEKEKDWNFKYPDNAGGSMAGLFFDMLKIEENIKFLQPNILHPKDIPPTLIQFLEERGYDYTTLKLTIQKKQKHV